MAEAWLKEDAGLATGGLARGEGGVQEDARDGVQPGGCGGK